MYENENQSFERFQVWEKATEEDLIRLGYPTIESLKSADPEELYRRDCEITGTLIDRCQLYVYRCAVYFAKSRAS